MNYADLVKETCTGTSTSTITLLGAFSSAFRTAAAAFSVGTTNIPICVNDAAGNFEIGIYTLTSSALLTRTSILSSSNGGAAVTFPAGTKTVTCVLPASLAGDFAQLSQGLAVTDLADAGTLADSDYIVVSQGGVEKKVTLVALKTYTGGAVQAPVTSLAAGTVTSTTVPLTWVNGSGGTSWTVTQRPTGSGSYTASTLSVAASATGAIVSGLTASTAYDFQVTDTGSAGTSVPTTLTNVSTSAAPVLSSPVGAQTGSTSGSGTVTTDTANGTLYFLASVNATEAAAAVKASGGTQAITTTGSKSVTFTGLSASTTYYAHYVHRNAAGSDSTVANSTSFTTSASATVPGAPTIGTATGGNASATVAYTAPGSNGGATIIDYTATSSPGGFTGTLTQAGSGTITVNGLTNGTAYTFTVTARNSVGSSSASSASNSVTPAAGSAPGAPTITLVAGVLGSPDMDVYFTPGSGTATSYTVNGGASAATGSSSPIRVAGLTAGTAYTLTMTATNGSGTSGSSAALGTYTANTITGYTGNAINSTAAWVSGNTSGSFSYIPMANQSTNLYWNFSPVATAPRIGWGTSPTQRPSDVTLANNQGGGTTNGLRLMGSATSPSWSNNTYLWVPTGSGTTTWYPWIEANGGPPTCLRPAGMIVTGA